LAAADPGAQAARLEGVGLGPLEVGAVGNVGQPEAELVGEVEARASGAVALDEGVRAEVLETGAGAGQRLAAALGARRRVHHEAVPDPQTAPAPRAVRHHHRLAVHCDHVRRRLAYHTSGTEQTTVRITKIYTRMLLFLCSILV